MDQEQEPQAPQPNPGAILREHLFDGDLLQLPQPEEGIPGFLPDWYEGTLPVLVYPRLQDQGVQQGDNVNLEVTPFHIYYGALRELAETADEERAEVLKQLTSGWNANAALEVRQLARKHIEKALLHCELAQELDAEVEGIDQAAEIVQTALDFLPDEEGVVGGDGQGEMSPEQEDFQEAQRIMNEDPQRAIELVQPLADAYPDTGELWFILGAAHRRAQDYEEAERCLRRAGRLAPQEPFVWWELSRTSFEAGRLKEGEDAIRKALELDAQNPIYLADLAKLLAAQGDTDGAEEAIQQAEELVPDDPEIQEARRLVDAAK